MVSEIAAKADQLMNEYERETPNSFWFRRRSNLCDEMAKQFKKIAELLREGRSIDFLADKPPEPVLKESDAPHIVNYSTLQGALENILGLLKNNNVKAIGVYGTKGVGKTAIVQNLNNNEEVAELFDMVIFIKMAADQTGKDLRQKIAKRLKVDIETVDEELKNKKYLLILDEVLKPVNLNQMGLLTNSDGSKVVITSQFPHVCKLSRMQRLIKVTQLSPEEAWKMFQEVADPVIDLPGVKPIARLVCEKCSCLPILIHKIASSFKLKGSASSWSAGLEDLKPWPELENQGLQELYAFLKFCYDELKDENKQKCFLYTSLYPADSKVYTDYLIECCAAQGFLGDVNDKRRYQSARNRGTDIVEHLVNVSLLEKGDRMSSDNLAEIQMCVYDRQQIAQVETERDCSKLLALLLQKNSELAMISQTAFRNMSSLAVLDLYGTGITQLPSSLSNLTGLKAFYLNDCKHLKELPPEIGSLQLLEVLDIRGSKISFIPSHIGCLANLRCLRIPYIRSSHQSLDIDADDDVISKLCKLEELIIEVMSYAQWCSNAENVIQQVASLKNLTTFRCSFPSAEIVRNFIANSLPWGVHGKFTSFRFFIGCTNSKRPQIFNSFEYRINKYVRYFNGDQQNDLAIGEVLAQTDAFELISHNDITALPHFRTPSLNCIRGFLIKRCNGMQTVAAGDGDDTGNLRILPSLEQLYLVSLEKLNCVFKGPFHFESFAKLQILAIDDCPLLKFIFSNGAIQHCSQLRKLVLENCASIEELIVVAEDMETEGNVLPKLEVLELNNLPQLRSICTNRTLAWPSLELIQIYGCPQLKFLPFAKDKAVNLRSIRGDQQWWDELERTDNEVHVRFQRMFRAKIIVSYS
ncbi:hypothetical protein L6164_036138 [Bauhinia variegata]|uniref:Uncharacterized protein n=1 Tax=Bauhinia variegata TaxID=167791 RepID=A0ACB9KGC7_BAUVA|nr:hypothetical protein L6164_036138 [Bauhinia variegata]